MSNQLPELSFETWCSKLFPAQYLRREERRTGDSSTNVDEKYVPESINFWHEFPNWVRQWKSDMLARGFAGPAFANLASSITWQILLADNAPEVLASEDDARVSLRFEFFRLVNQFNSDFRPLIDPANPTISRTTRICESAIGAWDIWSNCDVVTDGTDRMNKVALGEVKTPWVIKKSQYQSFINYRMPIANFGTGFVATVKFGEEHYNMGRGLTQIYSDLLTDRLSIGFLATTDFFMFCRIPPENPKALYIFPLKIERASVPMQQTTVYCSNGTSYSFLAR